MKKNKFILIFFTALFLFFGASSAMALEVTTYPRIPGLPVIEEGTKLPQFVIYFFGLGIYLAGALSLISLTIGAVGIIGAGATGNPSARGESMDRIKGAGLGLILTMASFLIIQTINPALTMPTLEPLGNLPGVYYTNNTETKPCPASEADTSNIPQGFETIKYTCDTAGPDLYVWIYPKTNFSDDDPLFSKTIVSRISCNGAPVSVPKPGSFKMAYATPGIYYFLDNDCKGYMSEANVSSQNEIQAPFKGNTKSVFIANDPQGPMFYGAIFHKEVGLQNAGLCSQPAFFVNKNCQNIAQGTSSAVDIFVLNNNPSTSGNGVVFYTETFGWSSGAQSRDEGVYIVKKEEITYPGLNKQTATMTFAENSAEHFYTLKTTDYMNAVKSFRDKPGSMEIRGKYLVALYSQNDCQTFYLSVANLNAQPLIPANNQNKKIDNAVIFPLK